MSSTGVMTRGLVLKRSCALCTVYGRSIRASAGRFRVTFKITVDAMYTPCFPICTYIPRFVYVFETGFSLACPSPGMKLRPTRVDTRHPQGANVRTDAVRGGSAMLWPGTADPFTFRKQLPAGSATTAVAPPLAAFTYTVPLV